MDEPSIDCQISNPDKPAIEFKFDPTDNGIFEFMTPDRAIELYKEIHSNGIPKLDWKFYGRRKPGEQLEQTNDKNGSSDQPSKDGINPEQNSVNNVNNNDFNQTEFDFDEEFGDNTDLNDSLCLKKRPDQISERKTNLSDIMIDIMKEVNHVELPDIPTLFEDSRNEEQPNSETLPREDNRQDEDLFEKINETFIVESENVGVPENTENKEEQVSLT